MALERLLNSQTTTGTSTPVLIGNLVGGPGGNASPISVLVDGITTGTLQVQLGPASTGPWETPTDGELTADGIVTVTAGRDFYLRLEVTVATDVDIDAWAG